MPRSLIALKNPQRPTCQRDGRIGRTVRNDPRLPARAGRGKHRSRAHLQPNYQTHMIRRQCDLGRRCPCGIGPLKLAEIPCALFALKQVVCRSHDRIRPNAVGTMTYNSGGGSPCLNAYGHSSRIMWELRGFLIAIA